MSLKRAEIKIRGSVQGVFFRSGVKNEAELLGLIGFVSNESDGSVSIVAEGEEEQLQKFLEWARLGTEQARVEKIEVEWKEASGELNNFEIR